MKNVEKEMNVRFTTLISPTLLSQLKLISYFTNTKLYEKVNHSVSLAILEFEKQYDTNIDSLIKLQIPKVESTPIKENKDEIK
tara:strand:+ start:4804 stop:5052 length:249 start_codon:yes stop_codon:yes gene_type:complete